MAEPRHRRPRGAGKASAPDQPPEAALADGSGVPLEAILCTEELERRPRRPADHATENRALVSLAQALADSPGTILQTLADTILEVFRAGSAGVSLLTKADGGKRFYWPAIAGQWRPHIGGGTPRDFGPCGDVLDRNAPLLFRHIERRYTYFLPVVPAVEECLLVPFYVEGTAVGTIWAVTHDPQRKFDAEDLRQLESLGRFASAAYQALEQLDLVERREEALRRSSDEARDSRLAALNLMEDTVQSRQLADALNARLASEIVERSQSEEAVRRRTAQFETLLGQAPIGVYLVDDRFRIREVNPTAFPFFGAIPDLIGRDLGEVLHRLWPEPYADQVVALFRQTLETGEPHLTPEQSETRLDRGQIETYEWRIHRIPLPEGRHGVVCYFRDISAQVLARRELAESQERLRQTAKMEAIGRLAGGMAHDFNNQLQALSGFAEFVARDPGLGGDSRQYLQEVRKAADRMASLTRQLLAFSRQQVLMPETLDLNVAARDSQALLGRLIGSNVEMRLALSPEPVWTRADRGQLLQVLMNLAVNARDAIPDGGELLLETGYREVGAEGGVGAAGTPVPSGRYIELVVTDSGAGIAPEDLPYLFEPFFTTKPVGKGTGLGLATILGIVSQSNGYVWAENAPSGGARFTVLLPLAAGREEAAPGRPDEGAAFRRGCVLVVEDEEAVRAMLVRALEAEGHEVFQARHGAEALDRLEREEGEVDVVISDLVMPVMGGRELGQRLAADWPELPVIWISGYPRDAALGAGVPREGQRFLQKPVPADLLIGTVRQVLESQVAAGPE